MWKRCDGLPQTVRPQADNPNGNANRTGLRIPETGLLFVDLPQNLLEPVGQGALQLHQLSGGGVDKFQLAGM